MSGNQLPPVENNDEDNEERVLGVAWVEQLSQQTIAAVTGLQQTIVTEIQKIQQPNIAQQITEALNPITEQLQNLTKAAPAPAPNPTPAPNPKEGGVDHEKTPVKTRKALVFRKRK